MLTENEITQVYGAFSDRLSRLWKMKVRAIRIGDYRGQKQADKKIDELKSAFQKIRENQEKLFAY